MAALYPLWPVWEQALRCDAVAVQGASGTPPSGEDLINTVPAQSLQSQTFPAVLPVVLCLGWFESLPVMKPLLFPLGRLCEVSASGRYHCCST